MVTEWTEEYLGRKPDQFEKISDTSYMQRRNIRRNTADPMDAETDPGWVCESRIIPNRLYEQYMEMMDSPTEKENQANMATVMLAIADIYEKISK